MKTEEAISILRGMEKAIGNANVTKIPLQMAIRELEKQMPAKPIIEKWEPARCPCCQEVLSEHMGDGYYKHWTKLDRCPGCGRRLEWY